LAASCGSSTRLRLPISGTVLVEPPQRIQLPAHFIDDPPVDVGLAIV
jgi:hypothetical protein